MVFETMIQEMVALEIIFYLELAFDDLMQNLFELLGGAMLETHYGYDRKIDQIGRNDVLVIGHMIVNSAKSKFVTVGNDVFLTLRNSCQSYHS